MKVDKSQFDKAYDYVEQINKADIYSLDLSEFNIFLSNVEINSLLRSGKKNTDIIMEHRKEENKNTHYDRKDRKMFVVFNENELDEDSIFLTSVIPLNNPELSRIKASYPIYKLAEDYAKRMNCNALIYQYEVINDCLVNGVFIKEVKNENS